MCFCMVELIVGFLLKYVGLIFGFAVISRILKKF